MKLLKSVLRQMLVSASAVCASMIVFTSCDSREDWFAKEGEGATFIIKSCKTAIKDFESDDNKYEFRNDTVYSDNNRVVEINLRLDEIEWEDDRYSPGVKYNSELLNLDVEGLGQKVSKSQYSDRDVTTDHMAPEFVQDGKGRFRFIKRSYGDYGSAFPTTSNDTTKAPILNTAHMIMEIEDVFRNKYYCHLKINCLGDIAPIPVMEMKDVDGKPMEKVFNLSKSHDKDGSVVKYEYCIDGEVVEYLLPTFDCDPAGVPSGKGAYGGTYITATELSEVKHAYQTKGEHIVFYRCMDNLGLWSLWGYKIVTIKKMKMKKLSVI